MFIFLFIILSLHAAPDTLDRSNLSPISLESVFHDKASMIEEKIGLKVRDLGIGYIDGDFISLVLDKTQITPYIKLSDEAGYAVLKMNYDKAKQLQIANLDDMNLENKHFKIDLKKFVDAYNDEDTKFKDSSQIQAIEKLLIDQEGHDINSIMDNLVLREQVMNRYSAVSSYIPSIEQLLSSELHQVQQEFETKGFDTNDNDLISAIALWSKTQHGKLIPQDDGVEERFTTSQHEKQFIDVTPSKEEVNLTQLQITEGEKPTFDVPSPSSVEVVPDADMNSPSIQSLFSQHDEEFRPNVKAVMKDTSGGDFAPSTYQAITAEQQAVLISRISMSQEAIAVFQNWNTLSEDKKIKVLTKAIKIDDLQKLDQYKGHFIFIFRDILCQINQYINGHPYYREAHDTFEKVVGSIFDQAKSSDIEEMSELRKQQIANRDENAKREYQELLNVNLEVKKERLSQENDLTSKQFMQDLMSKLHLSSENFEISEQYEGLLHHTNLIKSKEMFYDLSQYLVHVKLNNLEKYQNNDFVYDKEFQEILKQYMKFYQNYHIIYLSCLQKIIPIYALLFDMTKDQYDIHLDSKLLDHNVWGHIISNLRGMLSSNESLSELDANHYLLAKDFTSKAQQALDKLNPHQFRQLTKFAAKNFHLNN